jgi:hypothetical protein
VRSFSEPRRLWVIFGSRRSIREVRSASRSGHRETAPACPKSAGTGSNQLDRFGPNVALVERDAYTFFFAPNDMASPLELIARYKKREAVRDGQRGGYFERSTGF